MSSGHFYPSFIDLLIELIQSLLRDDGLNPIDNPHLILNSIRIDLMPMHHGYSRIEVESIRHVDQFQEIISIINFIMKDLHI